MDIKPATIISKKNLERALGDYRYCLIKISKLEEDLKYYELKSISPSGITYSDSPSIPKDPFKSSLVHYLCMIDDIRLEIEQLKLEIDQFKAFVESLTELEQQILNLNLIKQQSLVSVVNTLGITRNKANELKYRIKRKWYVYTNNYD